MPLGEFVGVKSSPCLAQLLGTSEQILVSSSPVVFPASWNTMHAFRDDASSKQVALPLKVTCSRITRVGPRP